MANVRYTQEKRIQVAEYVLDGRYSASVASKVFGIGVNTVCRWVSRLCEKRGLPCYRAERKGRRRESTRGSAERVGSPQPSARKATCPCEGDCGDSQGHPGSPVFHDPVQVRGHS